MTSLTESISELQEFPRKPRSVRGGGPAAPVEEESEVKFPSNGFDDDGEVPVPRWFEDIEASVDSSGMRVGKCSWTTGEDISLLIDKGPLIEFRRRLVYAGA